MCRERKVSARFVTHYPLLVIFYFIDFVLCLITLNIPTVFNLGILRAIFIRFQVKIKHCPIFPHSPNVKAGPL